MVILILLLTDRLLPLMLVVLLFATVVRQLRRYRQRRVVSVGSAAGDRMLNEIVFGLAVPRDGVAVLGVGTRD